MAPNKKQIQRHHTKRTHGTNIPSQVFDTRRLHQIQTDVYTLDTATSGNQSFLGTGSYFVSFGRDYDLRAFVSSTSSLVQVYDQYRFKKIDVYAVYSEPTLVPVFIHSSVDYDDVATPSWESLAQRSNVSMTKLSVNEPVRRLATWKPKGNFVASAGDSPANAIAPANIWWDTSILNQAFNGIKICMSSDNENAAIRLYATAEVEFKGRI